MTHYVATGGLLYDNATGEEAVILPHADGGQRIRTYSVLDFPCDCGRCASKMLAVQINLREDEFLVIGINGIMIQDKQ